MLSVYNPSYTHADLPVCNHSTRLLSYSQSLSRPTQGHSRENVQTGVIKANPWSEKFLELLFDWQKKKKKKKICAGFYGEPANSCLCNAEWQLPQRRTGFLIRINARRHSDLLLGCGINMGRESTETFQPCRGEPYYSTCTQAGSKWIREWLQVGQSAAINDQTRRFLMSVGIVWAWMTAKIESFLPLFYQLLPLNKTLRLFQWNCCLGRYTKT